MEPPKKIVASINTVSEAWADLAADKTFAGMTLEQFKVRVKPSLDARNELATARNTRINALTGRMVSDEEESEDSFARGERHQRRSHRGRGQCLV